jgi:rsbT co-antagonist protein RsbR
MMDLSEQGEALALMHEMGINHATIEHRKKIVGLEAGDLTHIAALRDLVLRRLDDYVAVFFDNLSGMNEGGLLLANTPLADKAKRIKKEHLLGMVSGNYDRKYVEQRLEIGLVYMKAGITQNAFLGAFHHLLRRIGVDLMKHCEQTPMDGFESFMSLMKVALFDISFIVDVLAFERERIIRQQQDAIRELSTPVLQIRERLLLVPIIGVIDTHRALLITESLLKAIRANRATAVVMDVTGVASIDSRVANHIIQTVTAARLMGAQVIVAGVSAEVAQSLVALGIELSKLNTVGDLQGGIEQAERTLGYRVLEMERSAAERRE